MPIRWGAIGCGSVCEIKSAPGLQRARDSALVAVMRRDGEKSRDYAERHGVPRWYTDADQLIADPEVDAVYVATPPGTHLRYALRVCEAGKPCYVEKPMARSHAECVAMNAAFAEAGLPLFVAHYRRALPRFLAVKELVDSGRLGRVTGILFRYAAPIKPDLDPLPWRLVAEEAGGGIFMDLGCHTLDIFDFLFGPLQEVSGLALNRDSRYAVEDGVAMTFRTGGGAVGTACWNFAGCVREDIIEITGTEGRVRLSTFGDEPLELEGHKGKIMLSRPNPPHIQQPLIQTIVDELLGRGKCPSTGESAARTLKVMDTVLAPYYAGRDDAFWSRPATWPRGRAPGCGQ